LVNIRRILKLNFYNKYWLLNMIIRVRLKVKINLILSN
jgi:hypothetical protein